MIGVFDSGYGGLTVLRAFVEQLPQYDYCYLGDNARAPYGNRSQEAVYQYTLSCVKYLFSRGCELVILACNTASAEALRRIQQEDLPIWGGNRRVLGVIRPTAEAIASYTSNGEVGVLATRGTVSSNAYSKEVARFFPQIKVYQEACPMWVALVENGEHAGDGADFFIKKHINAILTRQPNIDLLVLACTHYPLLLPKLQQYTPAHVKLISQADIVATSLQDYLKRHQEIECRLSKIGKREFLTTDQAVLFDEYAGMFYGREVKSTTVSIP